MVRGEAHILERAWHISHVMVQTDHGLRCMNTESNGLGSDSFDHGRNQTVQ